MRNIAFENQTNSFFLSFGQRVYFFEENPKSVQDIIGDVYCPGRCFSNREKWESLGGSVTTPRSIYSCGNCGAWLFVHKVLFMLQEHVKTRKTDKTWYFVARKRWTWYPTNSCYLMCHFNPPKRERKNCVWRTKYERLSEMCIVQNVEMKTVFTIQPIKRLVSTTVQSAKPAATFWTLLFRTKNRQLTCLAVTVHIVLQERRVGTMKKKSHLHFLGNFSANHKQAHPNMNQKRLKWVQVWNKRIRFLLADKLSDIFIFQIILFNFNLQSTVQIYSTYSQLTENQDLISLQRWNPVDSRLWSRLCYDCSKWSRSKYNSQLTRNTPSCLAMAVVSKARFLG